MWPESSSVNAVNLVKKSAKIPEISNFSPRRLLFLARPVDRERRCRCDVTLFHMLTPETAMKGLSDDCS